MKGLFGADFVRKITHHIETSGKSRLSRTARLFIFAIFIVALVLQVIPSMQQASADVAGGYSEYYIPGAADDIQSILKDLTNTYTTASTLTNVITMPITAPNLTIYYDHWENGYLEGAAGDEVFTGFSVGNVVTFKSTQIPNPRGASLTACANSTNPSGASSNCYDGRDRIFVMGGAVSLSQVYWPTSEGTVFANAWELYPVKPWETTYRIPVGEDLYANNAAEYADFDCVYVLVTAWQDATTVTFDNTRTAAPGAGTCGAGWWQDGSVTLNKGQTYFRGGVNSGSTITANNPTEVQMIVGREDSGYDSRSHTLVPTGEWDDEYYSPVSSFSDYSTPVQSNAANTNSLEFRKTSLERAFRNAGEIIHYRYSLRNTSPSTSRIGPVTINDNKTTNETCPALTTVGDGDNYLDPGETIICTSSYTITAADVNAGNVVNIASANIGGVNSASSTLTLDRSSSTITTRVNLYIFNPTAGTLAVTYQDTTGSVVCNIPAGSTMSSRDCAGRYVPIGSAAKLTADQKFYVIGEYDSGSSSRNWGFSVIPAASLGDEYFIPWAPGDSNVPAQSNGSPLFVTPTVNGQTIYVDFSPFDGVADETYTLNALSNRKIVDPDLDNTGMHLWSDYPFAITWGEDAQYSDTGNPYIDAGYTIPPPTSRWIDIIIDVNKSANPEVITQSIAGQEVVFTIDVGSGFIPLNNIFIQDFLPPYFAYKPLSTVITWPGGSSTAEPTSITGNAASGYTLRWGAPADNIGDLGFFETMTLSFTAVTVSGFSALTSVNNASGTGYVGSLAITGTAQATVLAGQPGTIVVIKDAQPDSPQDFSFLLVNQSKPNDPTPFQLDDDPASPLPATASFGLRPGTYSISEVPLTGWNQTSATCVSSDTSKTPTPGSISLAAGETVTCTFVNTAQVDIAVNKSDGDYSIRPYPSVNTPYKYTVSVSYPGPGAVAYAVQMIDTLDPFLDYISDTDVARPYTIKINTVTVTRTCTWVDDNADGLGGTLTCALGDLNPGDTAVIEFWVKAASGVPLTGLVETGECTQSASDPADVCNLVEVTTTSTDLNLADNKDSEPKDLGYPTAVALAWFDVTKKGTAGITLGWETVNESEVLSFNLYRAGSDNVEKKKLIAADIPAQKPGELTGAVYSFKDKTLKPDKTYYYWLETFDREGEVELIGPVKARLKK